MFAGLSRPRCSRARTTSRETAGCLALAGARARRRRRRIGQVVQAAAAALPSRGLALGCRDADLGMIYRVLYEGVTPKVAVQSLMQRTVKSEQD
jgi:glycerol-3-phosphate dehydrogenase